MGACGSCGARSRAGDETCAFCGNDLFEALNTAEVEELSRVFLTTLNESLKNANGPRVWAAVPCLAIFPVLAYLICRYYQTGWIATGTAIVFAVVLALLVLGLAVQEEQELFFERSLKKKILDFLEEHRIEKTRFLLAASKVMPAKSEILKHVAKL